MFRYRFQLDEELSANDVNDLRPDLATSPSQASPSPSQVDFIIRRSEMEVEFHGVSPSDLSADSQSAWAKTITNNLPARETYRGP